LSRDAFVSAAFRSLARGYLDTLHRMQRRAHNERRSAPLDRQAMPNQTIAAAPPRTEPAR
jgi:hypothetical protein